MADDELAAIRAQRMAQMRQQQQQSSDPQVYSIILNRIFQLQMSYFKF
jgi:hypothetical protein